MVLTGGRGTEFVVTEHNLGKRYIDVKTTKYEERETIKLKSENPPREAGVRELPSLETGRR